jgi:hypothetical protein
MTKEELTRPAQEQDPETPATPETLFPEKIQELATSKESALTDLAMRSANETKGIETGFAQSAQDLGGTPEDIVPVTAQLEALESEKERVIEDARGEIQAEAVVEDSRRNAKYTEEMLDVSPVDKPAPPPPPNQPLVPTSELKERNIKNPDELSAREFSKENLASQRQQLAEQIRQERAEAREKILSLRTHAEELQAKLEQSEHDMEATAQEFERLQQERSDRADSLAGRFRSFLHIETAKDKELNTNLTEKQTFIESTQAEKDEAEKALEEMNALIDADATFASMKEKIAAHYGKADELMHKTVEQTMLRNKVFFIHTINEHPRLRHNANSNVSEETTFEDDLDVLLSLEPSLSASTISSGADEKGNVSGLWSQSGGVLLSGGSISAASHQDMGTISSGIKSRWAGSGADADPSIERIDRVSQVRRSREGELGGYNELVVNNAEVSGYFKPGAQDENGTFWANGLDMKNDLVALRKLYEQSPNSSEYADASRRFYKYLNEYKDRFDLMKSKGIPFYVMTPDRRLFECTSVNGDGSLSVGAELTPEGAAKGRAGLSPEKRKEIGSELLQKRVFRKEETHNEAQEIITNL